MYCGELEKEFETKELMFAELKANKDLLIAKKKSQIKMKKNTFGLIDAKSIDTTKGLPNMEDGYIYAVISNTNYIDSHKDVHMNGSMTKTINEQQGKVYYVADHDLKITSLIATKSNVEMMLMEVDWKDLGKPYEGKTQCMVFKVAKDKIMLPQAKQIIESKEPIENSIRMQYVTLDLAVNSTNEEFETEYKNWVESYPRIANKEKVEDYFWIVRELKIVNEGSMVLFGSNDATPIDAKENTQEAVTNTSNQGSSIDTPEFRIKLQKLLEQTKI